MRIAPFNINTINKRLPNLCGAEAEQARYRLPSRTEMRNPRLSAGRSSKAGILACGSAKDFEPGRHSLAKIRNRSLSGNRAPVNERRPHKLNDLPAQTYPYNGIEHGT